MARHEEPVRFISVLDAAAAAAAATAPEASGSVGAGLHALARRLTVPIPSNIQMSWVSCRPSSPILMLFRVLPVFLSSQYSRHSSRSSALARKRLLSHQRGRPHSSSWMKGLAISSLPSTGEITTRSVPRATMRPSLRYRTLPSSSAAGERGEAVGTGKTPYQS
jgi:hypothetical protein